MINVEIKGREVYEIALYIIITEHVYWYGSR